jgi:hypothetical protein
MLQVGVHHGRPRASGGPQTLDDRAAQAIAASRRPNNKANGKRKAAGIYLNHVRGFIDAVIDKDDFESQVSGRLVEPVQKRFDVGCFIPRGHND